MSHLELITTEKQWFDAVSENMRDAEAFSFCTPAIDSAGGKWRLWKLIEANSGKLKHAFVALDGLRSEPFALDFLYRKNLLRWLPAADGSFRVNLWRFTRGDEVRVLAGGGLLCPPGLTAPADAAMAWAGSANDAFALQVERLFAEVSKQAVVPNKAELDEYAKSYERGLEHWQELDRLGAAYIEPAVLDTELPTLELVTTKRQVAEAVAKIREAFEAAAGEPQQQPIGFPGGSVDAEICWIPALSVWAMFDELDNRYWNSFGIEQPDKSRTIPAAVEINIPLSGINRRIAGAIGLNPATEELYLLHRGRIGGGGKGIGAELFWRRFRGAVWVRENGRIEPTRAALVARLDSPQLVRDVAAFVHQVARMKDAVR